MNQIVTSALGLLNLRDLLQGTYMAVLGAVTGLLYQWIDSLTTSGVLVMPDFKKIGSVAAIAAIAYLFKKILTPAQIITPAPSSKQ